MFGRATIMLGIGSHSSLLCSEVWHTTNEKVFVEVY